MHGGLTGTAIFAVETTKATSLTEIASEEAEKGTQKNC